MHIRLPFPLRRFLLICALALLAPALAGCGAEKDNRPWVKDSTTGRWSKQDTDAQNSIFGEGGLTLLGGDEKTPEQPGGGGIGVNAFLWRASLNTMAFMPLTSADPFGGVILTDWYQPEGSTGERFKVNVYILGTELRSDGLKVSVFRQIRQGNEWFDAPTSSDMATDLEDAILLAARQLRMARAE